MEGWAQDGRGGVEDEGEAHMRTREGAGGAGVCVWRGCWAAAGGEDH